jgi:acylphosphatase
MASRKQAQVFFSGRVQGVGFRYTIKKIAAGFEVVGTVRNLPDGRVELMAEGSEVEVQAFLEAIAMSELAGFIKEREVKWSAAQGGYPYFQISG